MYRPATTWEAENFRRAYARRRTRRTAANAAEAILILTAAAAPLVFWIIHGPLA